MGIWILIGLIQFGKEWRIYSLQLLRAELELIQVRREMFCKIQKFPAVTCSYILFLCDPYRTLLTLFRGYFPGVLKLKTGNFRPTQREFNMKKLVLGQVFDWNWCDNNLLTKHHHLKFAGWESRVVFPGRLRCLVLQAAGLQHNAGQQDLT